jgi:hypothetical protein
MGSCGQAVNLKQYRRLDGKWQFVPVVKENGKPNQRRAGQGTIEIALGQSVVLLAVRSVEIHRRRLANRRLGKIRTAQKIAFGHGSDGRLRKQLAKWF